MLLWLSHFPPFTSLHPAHLPLPHSLPIVHGWVIHISSLTSTFPTLFLPSPCLFCTYHLCFLFPVPSPPPVSPSPLITLHVISIFVNLYLFQTFAQFIFAFDFLGVVVDRCEFVVILLFIVLIFFSDKFLQHFI